MTDNRFFKSTGFHTLGEIADEIGAEIADQSRAVLVHDVAPLCDATEGYLSFFDNKKYLQDFISTKATACITHPANQENAPKGLHLLVTPMPYYAYAKAAAYLFPFVKSTGKQSPHAFIDPTAKIGKNVEIGHGSVIEANVELGDNTIIKSNVSIGENVIIGSDCVIDSNASISYAVIGNQVNIFPGVMIGQAGFGFAFGPNGYENIPQLGRVVVHDKVLIGANTTIDRGSNQDTVIGKGTMIDNLVQIGHNVRIGKMCVIVAQTGIAGSTIVDDYVMMGGQCGIAGHLKIGTGAKLAARSAVAKDIPAGQEYMGVPAVPKKQFASETLALARLLRKGKKQ